MTKQIPFPRALGGTTSFALPNAVNMTLFMVDPVMPLFNVVVGGVKFFATECQVREYVAEVVSGERTTSAPAWRWVFETGFDKSVDGQHKKSWTLKDGGGPNVA